MDILKKKIKQQNAEKNHTHTHTYTFFEET